MLSLLPPSLLLPARAALSTLSTSLLSSTPPPSPTLASGSAGLSLAHAYLSRAFPDRPHAEAAARLFSDAFARAPGLPPSLLDGFAGVAWVADHLRGEDSEDPNTEVDVALLSLLEGDWRGTFGVSDGLAGLGIYSLERGEPGAELLERIVHRLTLGATRALPGVAWRDGNASVAALLAAASVADVAKDVAQPLFKASAEWLVAQPDLSPIDALALVRAAQEAGGKGVEKKAIAAALKSIDAADAAPEAASGPVKASPAKKAVRAATQAKAGKGSAKAKAAPTPDAAAGTAAGADAAAHDALDRSPMWIAHAFHALHVLTGDPRFATAARSWFKRLLAEPIPDAPGLLDGRAGLALILSAAVSKDESALAWNRVLVPAAAP
jgi:hypothetical protein